MGKFVGKIGRKSVIVVTLLMASFICCQAEVKWLLYAGGMYGKAWQGEEFYGGMKEKINSYDFTGGLSLQISLRGRFYLETGIGYRRGPFLSVEEDTDCSHPEYLSSYEVYDKNYNDWLHVPLKLGYCLPLSEKTSLMLAVGPYVDMAFETGYGDSPIGVGLMPSIALRHRKFNIGVQYQNPVFVNGTCNVNKSVIMATIGLSFNIGKIDFGNVDWLGVANALSATGEALSVMSGNGSASQSYSSVRQTTTSNSTYSASETSQESKKSTSSNKKDAKKGSQAELTAFNSDRRTYSNEETLIIKLYSDLQDLGYSKEKDKSKIAAKEKQLIKDIKDTQARMKKIRSKWEARGYEMYHSSWEDKSF